MKTKGNIFSEKIIKNTDPEYFETLFEGKAKIEKIISSGHTTPEEQWYDQEEDEWVVLVQGNAKILFGDNEEVCLGLGDYIFIPKHRKHRVTFTSENPQCIWIAIHGKLIGDDQQP